MYRNDFRVERSKKVDVSEAEVLHCSLLVMELLQWAWKDKSDISKFFWAQRQKSFCFIASLRYIFMLSFLVGSDCV